MRTLDGVLRSEEISSDHQLLCREYVQAMSMIIFRKWARNYYYAVEL